MNIEVLRMIRKLKIGTVNIKIKKIKIPKAFTTTCPSAAKMQRKYSHYRKTKQMMEKIVVNRNGILLDGYTTYLLCKMFDIKSVEVEVRDEHHNNRLGKDETKH